MDEKRFMVVSGFLGAGKTTTMVALTEYINSTGKHAAIIANDLGANYIIDAEYSDRQNVEVTPIGGDCICYIPDTLIERIERLNREPKDLVMSDIPGCGIVHWIMYMAIWTRTTRMSLHWLRFLLL
ncbi:MAG: GTP-binding protein [Lachnospiraceae bacterium]